LHLAWKQPSPEVAAILDEALEGSGASQRMMFGCPSYSLAGNLFAGAFGDQVFVRLPEADRAEAVSEGGSPFEPLEGRTLRMYVVLPAAAVADGEALSSWLRRSMDFVSSLPKRPRKRARARRKSGK
jgi:TfoX/Sxy family transcriptional regulator of competence genes